MREKRFMKRVTRIILIAASCLLVIAPASFGRALFTASGKPSSPKATAQPNTQFEAHKIGKIALTVTNFGNFGTGYLTNPELDGDIAPSCEFPINSDLEYLFAGGIWIGAIVGRDTLVSVGLDGWSGGNELFPDAGQAGAIRTRSNIASSVDFDIDAVSEQDILCTFTDTFTDVGLTGQDVTDNRPHIPLNVEIRQNSYAWSYEYAEDFVLIDYKIRNMGAFDIKDLYMGIYIDGDVGHQSIKGQSDYIDDICGFKRTVETPPDFCIDRDTVNIAWIADNDGDPVDGEWSFTSPRAVTATRVIRTPNPDLKFSFNWWISNTTSTLDFGPRLSGTADDPFRSFGTHKGTPTGDRNKYYIMRHEEFDYDQLFTAISHTGEGWEPPPSPPARARDMADGFDTRYLLSFGPFTVPPDSVLPITIAYVAGDEFHQGPNDFADYFDALAPQQFYNELSFTDLGKNARWASWVFDNPGVDTDENGDTGNAYCWQYVWDDTTETDPSDSVIVDSSKFYYAGDGVPDFRGAAPPTPPKITVMPRMAGVTIRWNGQITENDVDPFAGEVDFEGYRVYFAENDRLSDFVLLTSYDKDDYKVYQFNSILQTWEQRSLPLTLDSLRTLYGVDFEPLDYSDEFNSFSEPGTGKLLYFQRQDWNQSQLQKPGIYKVYPNASLDDPSDTTDEGFLRYYEYAFDMDNLLPSIPYYFSVTAFDYGSLKVDLGALESSPLINVVMEYPLPSAEQVEKEGMKVSVYPNPYRIDANYAVSGFENRDRVKSNERSRQIVFANLPRVCTIRIFTIDGDLVREIEHNYPEGGPTSQIEVWDVITRNTQAVVTGLYLWQVESEMGEQIGKLVIMK
jgi:hypothetical protein